MTKVLLVVVIAAFGLYAYQRVQMPEPARVHQTRDLQVEREDSRRPAGDNTRFHCDGRTHCSEMKSCDEALFFLAHCPGTKMDGDRDGIPCEGQHCGH
ncbi:MAG TPA: excalibur calcium-binding domain-containing protein [Steroidobacteraceae bacterium]|nr:excalibur calcium-binding domain-containing protein [Steroidobacteraceae bacterium]